MNEHTNKNKKTKTTKYLPPLLHNMLLHQQEITLLSHNDILEETL